METKLCIICNEQKDSFLFERIYSKGVKIGRRCNTCVSKINSEKYFQEIEEGGGHDRVNQKPGQYMDETQKKNTFEFLLSIGWKLNPINNVWYKDGIKDKDGKFLNLKKKRRKRKTVIRYNEDEIICDGKWVKLKEVVDKIIEMDNKGLSTKFISMKMKISQYRIKKYINIHNETHQNR